MTAVMRVSKQDLRRMTAHSSNKLRHHTIPKPSVQYKADLTSFEKHCLNFVPLKFLCWDFDLVDHQSGASPPQSQNADDPRAGDWKRRILCHS